MSRKLSRRTLRLAPSPPPVRVHKAGEGPFEGSDPAEPLADRAAALVPEDWMEEAIFRESFVTTVEDPELASRMHRVGACLALDLVEEGKAGSADARERRRLRGVIDDLRHCQGHLARIGEVAAAEKIAHRDQFLGEPCTDAAEVLAALAARLQETLDRLPARDEPVSKMKLQPNRVRETFFRPKHKP